MTFGIDFDGTFAAAPELWREFVRLAKEQGHICVLVTQRTKEFSKDVYELVGDLMPVVLAGGMTKREAAARCGYKVDVWVDDNPQYVDEEMVYSPVPLKQFRVYHRDGNVETWDK